MLLAETTAESVEAALGTSPSGTKRLDFYRRSAIRDRQSVLARLFPATRAASGRVDAALWRTLVDAYLTVARSTHWDPNRIGEDFSDFLAARRVADATLPAFLEELADYEATRYAITRSPAGALEVRQYMHDVRDFHLRGATDPNEPLPPARATVIVVHRTEAHHPSAFAPSAAAICAIARRRGLTRKLPEGVTERAVDEAELALIACGALSP